LSAQIPQEGDEPFSNYTSFAILPEAVTKQYKPEEIPFTTRDWDDRIAEYITLSDRLGIRIADIWGGWSADPPYAPHAPQIDLVEKLGMGVLTGSPTYDIENHLPGYQKYDETALREGVRNWIATYGKVRPLIIDLGNEPHGTGQQVVDAIKAYRIVYDEVKKIDPSIMVLGTSVGPDEEYFKDGFQDCCDAYDFHVYEGYQNVALALQKYHALFKKYGGAKPVWSTELGLNSQGMTRRAVADELYRKFAVFFANGGANASWFDLLYPDAAGTQGDSVSASFDVFDSRYSHYCPKLDAIAYYNAVNAICIKKFVEQKQYPDGTADFLFRDRDGKCLQILWRDAGRADVGIPLNGVDAVEAITIDGRRTALHADGKAISVSVGDDPLLLLYDGGGAHLPDQLSAPTASISTIPNLIVKGEPAAVAVRLNGMSPDDVTPMMPPLWQVQRTAFSANAVTFSVQPPESSAIRIADIRIKLKNSGELEALVPVSGPVAMRVVPEPAHGKAPPSVALVVKNNSNDPQPISWQLSIPDQMTMVKGAFGAAAPATAYFADAASGQMTVGPNATSTVSVPLSAVDPLAVYHVKAAVTDSEGHSLNSERSVAGFVAVPKASGPLALNGTLSSADWDKCPVELIDKADQYRVLDSSATSWKGPKDLSGKVRFLWDDRYLYVGVEVADDVFSNTKVDADIWAGDGLQFLIDPARERTDKPGKYDYAMAVTSKGPLAWCYLSASPQAPTGEVKSIVLATHRENPATGDMTYEIAIPWSRLAPFKPAPGADLGLSIILNEDDGNGRHSFMGWFGDEQSKSVDVVGDLILQR
jgi:hypothetical protein